MGNTKLTKLRDKYMEELEGMYKEGPLEAAKVQLTKDLAKTIYYLDFICQEDEMYNNENSYESHPHNSRRDVSNAGTSYRGTSYGRWPMSYDDAKSNIVHKLEDLMTENENMKVVLRNAINQLESSK